MLLFVFVSFVWVAVQAANPCPYEISNSTSCCNSLHDALGSKTNFPLSLAYTSQQTGPSHGYWSLQEVEITPTCRITPASAQDVATAVLILSRLNCSFAVRGGGHTSWGGAANIQDGITIDLSSMSVVNVSSDRSSVSVGAGARWQDVYGQLDPLGLAVAGGRASPVGVAGLTLGGGKSFFSSKVGFACDNVKAFQLVTGQGRILRVSATLYPDLFKALKGGNNNFGIVLSFELYTFPQGQLWGGFVIYPALSALQQYTALSHFIDASGAIPNPPGDVQVILAYVRNSLGIFFANFYSNTLPNPYPKMLTNFTSIQPRLQSTLRVGSLSNFTAEVAAGTPDGQRYLFGTATFGNSAFFFQEIQALSDAIFGSLFTSGVDGLQVSTVLQPLTKPMLAPGCGRNSMGLCPSAGNLVILDLTVSWTDVASDAMVNKASQTFIGAVTARANQLGISHEYIYLNYAMQVQDPIASYGTANVQNMRAVSRKYDPAQVFQKLVPGGFKLYR